jgi:Glycoside Hydrolase Family 113
VILAALLPALCLAHATPAAPAGRPEVADGAWVRGMTVSCRTWGWEWGTDDFARELDRLAALGVNWVAIHPYASIRADGTVSWRGLDPEAPPEWIARPIREAHARGLSILVIPHLAYWHSPFSWRGAIGFDDPEAVARFFDTYGAWTVAVARAARGADALSVGNELERMVPYEAQWRRLIGRVRAVTDARLTYAANWDGYAAVRFWDALDAIGVQAYFPLSDADDPSEAELAAGWRRVLPGLRELSRRTGKPVVFTELGYNASLAAAREPWGYREERGPGRSRAEALQERCLRVALREIDRERDWLRGAFLWKWFVGGARGENFLLDREPLCAEIREAWR